MYDHCDNIVTEEADATKWIAHVNCALGTCSYLSWSFKRVRELKKNLTSNKKDSKDKSTKTRFTLPYIRGVSEALSQVFHRHGVAMSMKPYMTLKVMLVNPKEKCTPQENTTFYTSVARSCHLPSTYVFFIWHYITTVLV